MTTKIDEKFTNQHITRQTEGIYVSDRKSHVLAIRGIRSFDNQSMAVIQFYSPLTVIVGHNGSGKTVRVHNLPSRVNHLTIIESLKYITTGDLPPNTKGGAFVHDPSIAGESVVMAEVLLRFKNLAGTKLVASRRLQVSKKKNTALTMKTLEGTLSYNDDSSAPNSKRRTISTKCAEMDSEVPRHLGISKAILENVIFCHQEDSNWPLSEPASLKKKKIDSCFLFGFGHVLNQDSTKFSKLPSLYTKALDNIKSIKKEAASELKVDKEKFTSLTTDKNRAEKLQTTIDKLTASIAAKEAKYKELETEVRSLSESNKTFYQHASRFHQIVNEHSTLSDQKANKVKIAEELKEDMEEITNGKLFLTLSQLREQREQSKSNLSNHAERLAHAKSELAATETELARLRRKHQTKLTELGQLKAQAHRKLAALEERQQVVSAVSSTHNIPEFRERKIEDSRMAEFSRLLRDRQQLVVTKLQSTKVKFANVASIAAKKAEEEKQTEIFELKGLKASTQQQKQVISDRMVRKLSYPDPVSETRTKVRSLVYQIENIKVSEADITHQSDDLTTKQQSLLKLKEQNDNCNHDQKIQTKQQDMRNLERSRDELHAELVRLNRESDTRAKLSLKRADITKRQQGIEALIKAHGTKFEELVETKLIPKTAEEKISAILTLITMISLAEDHLSDAMQHCANDTKEMQTLHTKLQMSKSKLASSKEELQSIEKKIKRVTEGSKVSQQITETEGGIEEIQKFISFCNSISQFSAVFHEKLLAKAHATNKCGACQRGFHGDDEMINFESYCKDTIKALPTKRAEGEESLRQWKAQLDRLKKLLPLEISATKLQDVDIPKLQSDISTLETSFDTSSRTTEEAQSKVEKLKDRISELELCKRSAVDVSRMSEEIDELNKEIKNLERDLESSGTTRTADQVQEELDDLQLNLGELKRELESLITERDRKRTAFHNLETEIHQLELSLNLKRQQKKEKEAFEVQKEGLKKEIVELEGKMKTTEETLKTFAEPLRTKESQLEEIRAENVAAEAEQTNELQSYNKSLSQLDTINREIERFDQMDIGANCERCQREIDALDERIKSSTQQISHIQETLIELDKEEDKAKAFERNITDNIRYRTYIREIQELEEKINAIDVRKAKEAFCVFPFVIYGCSQQAKLGGEIGMDKHNLNEKKEERESDYKDIIKRHRSQLVKVKVRGPPRVEDATVEIANQDLDKYAKALDQAIMKYHSHKMAEINDTIQTLWQKTYQGTGSVIMSLRILTHFVFLSFGTLTLDIDNISIKSENENAKSNRSYNYRVSVVMMKDQVEMDMRGRCSAGQKVLASIIIRLALAESFGTNCGILALDEPTTNLDKENINALADSLAEIIKERKDQANFQLVVIVSITHDEEFLNRLGQSDVLDKYWRVSRNLQQKSIIERQRMI
ncbi:hypothetical protein VP01_287g3 [Puccinia sorghi]|uniref:DNA repair protein RAD50 n=1 Tax=Puccinia sorghi TaxID=27349 RepID=A0A0L6V3K1_9BASI|nr:hypothetical protein VP01_287g3 [Puccinia sorghi]